MKTLLALASLLFVPLAFAGDILIESKVSDGVAVLTAKTTGKTVVWIPLTDGLKPLSPDLFKDSKTFVASGKPGLHRVLAIAAEGDKPLWGDVSFSIDGPEPPAPGPGPTPVPPPPPLIDDLPKRLKDAYAAETTPGRRGQLISLIGIYTAMADHAEKDASITTSRALLDVLQKVKAGMLADGVLLDMRRILAAETSAAIGSPSDMPLDRGRAAAHFKRVVKSLPQPE